MEKINNLKQNLKQPIYFYPYQSLILQSGIQAQWIFYGGLSVDVSADLAFSLFTQESKTTVNNKYVKFTHKKNLCFIDEAFLGKLIFFFFLIYPLLCLGSH